MSLPSPFLSLDIFNILFDFFSATLGLLVARQLSLVWHVGSIFIVKKIIFITLVYFLLFHL